ncbi:FAD binding domain-containing protein [Salipiger sp. 1_MG-2023]|uniref:FAD binding domain-containing protein n=1 Tax=Salipiger sp. 1_MG-2023 TaxID=3062665 RepID=UPI0026E3219A|nr:FAD binding domain-containing protein [Salipiger sp. 1_MG-2023]MDO6585811.1 FAD binding domain-containing protein [Salipiger sp. 1_MG-2023]
MLTYDAYHRPTSLPEALRLWRDAPEGSRLVSGATDLLPAARDGRLGDVHLPALIDLTGVTELRGYDFANGHVALGAGTVYQDFLTDPVLRRALPCMPYVSIWFADDQIRETATLAGNLVNASPVADGTPPVVALNGLVELSKLDGDAITSRRVAVRDFITGPGRTVIAPGEIMTRVFLDTCYGYGGAFQKVGQRRSLVISVACCAALVKLDESGRVFEDVRLALGGVGPGPIRLDDSERMLRGEPLSEELMQAAAGLAAEKVASRSRRDYRRDVVVSFVRAALSEALSNAGAKAPLQTMEDMANV